MTSLTFQENVSASTQTINGISMVGHSIYACVAGGTDTDVAAALLENKSSGCAWNGGTTVNVVEPASGQSARSPSTGRTGWYPDRNPGDDQWQRGAISRRRSLPTPREPLPASQGFVVGPTALLRDCRRRSWVALPGLLSVQHPDQPGSVRSLFHESHSASGSIRSLPETQLSYITVTVCCKMTFLETEPDGHVITLTEAGQGIEVTPGLLMRFRRSAF